MSLFQQPNVILDCALPSLVGDGFCNDETNNPECYFDGGDCCGSCIVTDYCTNCTCIGRAFVKESPNSLVGNGYCNDQTNNHECKYDGGDCCLFGDTTTLGAKID